MGIFKIKKIKKIKLSQKLYDIEVKNNHNFFANDILVHNSHSGIVYNRDDGFHYFQRRFEILPDPAISEVHQLISVPNELGYTAIAEQIGNDFSAKQVIIRSEAAGPGIQSNIYKLPKLTLFVFDIQVDGRYLDAQKFIDITSKYNLKTAPIISVNKTLREWLNGKTIREASNGQSLIYPTLREGIVIKPMVETYDHYLKGRQFLKQRDPIYLDKTGH